MGIGDVHQRAVVGRNASAGEEIAEDMVGLDRHAALDVAQHRRRQRRAGQLAVTSVWPSASTVAIQGVRAYRKSEWVSPRRSVLGKLLCHGTGGCRAVFS